MSHTYALSPKEAAHMASNAYFVLEGWAKRYKYNQAEAANKNLKKEDRSKLGAKPGVSRDWADDDVIEKNVISGGPVSAASAGINNAKMKATFEGSSGSNLGRSKSGWGYVLQFKRKGKSHLVFAIRGTRPELGYCDLLTDLNMSPNRTMPGVGAVHAGFYDTYKSIKPAISAARNDIMAADYIHVVGHSLGGAVANLVALDIINIARGRVKLYTFGAPRTGLLGYDQMARQLIGESNIYRVSHSSDPIPMIPVCPFIHVVPYLHDRQNFFIKSPIWHISMGNHDVGKYIDSVGTGTWGDLRAKKAEEGYLSKSIFNSWRQSDNWVKKQVGSALNFGFTLLQKIFQGLIDTVGINLTNIATILDLMVLAIEKGVKYYDLATGYISRFLMDCASVFSVVGDMSATIMRKILSKMMREIRTVAEMALVRAKSAAITTEFQTILGSLPAAAIGIVFI